MSDVESHSDARRQRLRRRLFMVVPVVALAIGVYLFFFAGRYVSTENAYVKSDVVNVSAEIAGNVVAVAVEENQPVKVGDVLLRLDSSAYEARVREARAELERARIHIESLRAAYVQKQAALAGAKDDLVYAEKQQQRIQDLYRRGGASSQQRDQVQRDLDVARNVVSRLQSEKAETLAELGGRLAVATEHHPEVEAAQADLEQALLDLEHCTLRAPTDGVAAKVPAVGQYAMPGMPMVSVVADEHSWIEVNFKEDQLAGIEPGARVLVEIDAYPGREWTGRVDSIAQATGAEFALLPPQNATGNWVKVVQRVPVRLNIERREGDPPLRAGLSAEVSVDLGTPHRLQVLSAWFGEAGNAAQKKESDAALVAGPL